MHGDWGWSRWPQPNAGCKKQKTHQKIDFLQATIFCQYGTRQCTWQRQKPVKWYWHRQSWAEWQNQASTGRRATYKPPLKKPSLRDILTPIRRCLMARHLELHPRLWKQLLQSLMQLVRKSQISLLTKLLPSLMLLNWSGLSHEDPNSKRK